MPERITLSRAKGWKMPPNTVVVARPTKWGNPFQWQAFGAATHLAPEDAQAGRQAQAVEQFREWLHQPEQRELLAQVAGLRGKHLACWCKPGTPCHADVLLEIANG